ncbi:MAG: L-histidine N(alpha)-methyltransferase [Rhodospirillaceae bacterium]|jgi:dimethylhistidine N-methyltransferase|nr:L-histidine N(alpha)-methyltransferase [Rhodospirillaceae bacterium]MBT5456545.1 L-histidine N(alpha)-methyltransferase [Rhodospirillaceae bacterium]
MGLASTALATFHDLSPVVEDFEEAVMAGLSAIPKTVPCKYFYDQRGSELFDEICALDEYYVTRTETAILTANAGEIAALMGESWHLVEFGSGSSIKVRLLLDALNGRGAYTAIDISRDHLLASATRLAEEYPGLTVSAMCADYTRPFDFPAKQGSNPVVFFPGSTIGNFTADQALEFLTKTADQLRPLGGALLIGADLKKDVTVLKAAYNDSKGVTAAFNLNLLIRANKELGANFDLSAFHHDALYDEESGRIEMHIISDRRQTVQIGSASFKFEENETIHTENSHKYSVAQFQDMGRAAGFDPTHVWTDDRDLFSVHYWKAI